MSNNQNIENAKQLDEIEVIRDDLYCNVRYLPHQIEGILSIQAKSMLTVQEEIINPWILLEPS